MAENQAEIGDDESWKTPLVFLRSLIFNIYVRISSVFLFIVLTPFLLFGVKSSSFASKIWGYNSVFAAKYIIGLGYEVRGEIPERAVIFACKHQSAWETAVFHVLVKQPAYVFKKELLYVPLFNLYMLLSGQIPVDRKAAGASIKSLVRNVRDRVAKNRHVIIFPEGTRMEFGAAPDYKSGIVALHSSVEADIVPVALNSGKFWGRNSFWKRPGKIMISFLPPIPKDTHKKEFMQLLEQQIETECVKIG